MDRWSRNSASHELDSQDTHRGRLRLPPGPTPRVARREIAPKRWAQPLTEAELRQKRAAMVLDTAMKLERVA